MLGIQSPVRRLKSITFRLIDRSELWAPTAVDFKLYVTVLPALDECYCCHLDLDRYRQSGEPNGIGGSDRSSA